MIDPYISEHAIYEDNQLLTSVQLNTSFKHLEQQILTRSAVLTDTGVVQGFEYGVYRSGNNITHIILQTGFAVTPDGYLIPGTDENGVDYDTRIYTHSKPFSIEADKFNEFCRQALFSDPNDNPATTPVECYELFTSSVSGSSAISHPYSTFAKDYLLAWYVDVVEEDVDSCNSNSCDDGGRNRTEVTRLLLVPKMQAVGILFGQVNRPPAKHRSIHVQRLGSMDLYEGFFQEYTQYTTVSRDRLYVVANTLAQTNLTTIYNELKAIATSNLVSDKYTSFVKSDDYGGLYDKVNALQQQAANFKNQTLQTPHDYTKDNFLQAYLGFCQDMEFAINEFYAGLNALNDKVWNSPLNGGRRMRFVVLGEVTDPRPVFDKYRYYNANLSELYNETLSMLREVGTLNDRMWLMVDRLMYITTMHLPSDVLIPANQMDRYILDKAIKNVINTSPEPVRITPSRMAPSKLGEMAVPYYYRIMNSNESDPFWQVWKAGLKDKRNLNDICNYYDRTSAEPFRAANLGYAGKLNQSEYPLLRIEGLIQTSADRDPSPIYDKAKKNSMAGSVRGTILFLQVYRRAWNLSFGIFTLDLDGPTKKPTKVTGIAGYNVEKRMHWSEYVDQQNGYTNFIPGAEFGEYVPNNGSVILLLSHSRVVAVMNLPFMLPNSTNVSRGGLFEFLESFNDNYTLENDDWAYVGSGLQLQNLHMVPNLGPDVENLQASTSMVNEPLRFRKVDGTVHVRGNVKLKVTPLTLATLFQLPEGYIPPFQIVCDLVLHLNNGQFFPGFIMVHANDGRVMVVAYNVPEAATSAQITLDIRIPLN